MKLLTVTGLSFSNNSTSMSPKTVRNWARMPPWLLAKASRQKDAIRAGVERIGLLQNNENDYSRSAEFFNSRTEKAVVGDDAVAMLVIERFAKKFAPSAFND